MFDVLAELLVNLFGELLLACFGQDRGRLEPSPWERRQARAGFWWLGGLLFVAAMVAVSVWASQNL